jgi:putative NADPH-quinone reductase
VHIDLGAANAVARATGAVFPERLRPPLAAGPDLLKGFFDRVFLPGVTFKLGTDGIARPALTHVKRVIGITSYGRPWWVATFLMGDPPKRQIMNYFRLLTGGRARRTWLAHYDMNRATDATRRVFLAKVERAMERLA